MPTIEIQWGPMQYGGKVLVSLDDGASVELTELAAHDLYELLWEGAAARGSVSAAGKIKWALVCTAFARSPVVLDAAESAAFYAARGQQLH